MEVDNYIWLEKISAKINHTVLNTYRKDIKLFFNEFLIIYDDEFLIIGNKKTHAIYEFAKVDDVFIFEHDIEEKKTLFKFKNIEVIKKELV